MREYAPILISAAALIFTYYQYLRNSHREDTSQMTTVLIKLENIAEGVTEIKSDVRNMKKDVQDLRERVAKVEASASSAHKRLDSVVGGRSDRNE